MLKERFPYLEQVSVTNGDGWALVPEEKINETCMGLHDELKFDLLTCLTGTDRGDHFEITYHLYSYERKETLILKTKLSKSNPKIKTVSDVWPSANWMERETFDLLGIEFVGHKGLKRILLPEDWVGHPLCKDYMEPEEYCGMTTIR